MAEMTLRDALKVLHNIQDALVDNDMERVLLILDQDFDDAVEAIELAEAQLNGLKKLTGVRF